MNTKKATRLLSVVLGLALIPSAAVKVAAHEGHAHSMMGTIIAVEAEEPAAPHH